MRRYGPSHEMEVRTMSLIPWSAWPLVLQQTLCKLADSSECQFFVEADV